MTQQVEISAGDYTIILTGKSRETFTEAAQHPAVNSLTGEALVVALFAHGGITEVRRKNGKGKYSNGPNGEPAEQIWYESGKLYQVVLSENGQRNNGPNGEPAEQIWHENGQREEASFYENGKCNNGPNGEPAVQRWHENGKRSLAIFYENGQRNNGPNGEPAVQEWDENGRLHHVSFYRDGQLIRVVTDYNELMALYNQLEAPPAFEKMGLKLVPTTLF